MPELDQRLSHCFNQRCRAADEDARPFARRPSHFLQHRAIDPASESHPICGLIASESVPDFERRVVFRQPGELLPINHFVPSARRVQQTRWQSVPGRTVGGSERCISMAKHRHQRHDAGSASNEEKWATDRNVPNEVSADRTTQLERIASAQLVGEVSGDFALLQSLDSQ